MGNSTSLSLGSPRRLSGSAMDALEEYRATTFDGLRECRETLQELGKEELDEEDFDLVFSLTLADPATMLPQALRSRSRGSSGPEGTTCQTVPRRPPRPVAARWSVDPFARPRRPPVGAA